MASCDIDAFDDDSVHTWKDPDDSSAFAFVFSGDDENFVVSFYSRLTHGYKTSGASDTMRMNCLFRSSRATGPKIRVPLGF